MKTIYLDYTDDHFFAYYIGRRENKIYLVDLRIVQSFITYSVAHTMSIQISTDALAKLADSSPDTRLRPPK